MSEVGAGMAGISVDLDQHGAAQVADFPNGIVLNSASGSTGFGIRVERAPVLELIANGRAGVLPARSCRRRCSPPPVAKEWSNRVFASGQPTGSPGRRAP